MELREIMTEGVVTAPAEADVLSVARQMRDRGVGITHAAVTATMAFPAISN